MEIKVSAKCRKLEGMSLTSSKHIKMISFTCGKYFINTFYSNNTHSYQPEPGSVLLMGWIGNDFCVHSNQQILFQWSGAASERQGTLGQLYSCPQRCAAIPPPDNPLPTSRMWTVLNMISSKNCKYSALSRRESITKCWGLLPEKFR